MVAEWLPPMLAEGRDTDASLVADLTDMATQIGPIVHQQQIEALINRPNATEILPQISCPVLLITGDKIFVSLKQHQEMAELLPSVTLKVIKNAGHFMPIEQPDSTQSIIATWMRSTFPEGESRCVFIMTCRHHVGTAEMREANRASHRRWVDTGGDGLVSVLIGSAIVDDQQNNVGHFGILEAESQANALAFAEGDAFFTAGMSQASRLYL